VALDVDDDQGVDQGVDLGGAGRGGASTLSSSMSVSVDEGEEDGDVGSGPTPPSAMRKSLSPRLNALDKVGCVWGGGGREILHKGLM
jgi:hypothetical protein